MDFVTRAIHAVLVTHPRHPMVVHFPIALTSAAFLFVLLGYWRKSRALEQAAYANIVLASLGALAAGITGYLDNVANYDGDAPNAPVKVVLAIALFSVTVAICVLRHREPDALWTGNRLLYVTSYGVTCALALTLAFLGGVILYGY